MKSWDAYVAEADRKPVEVPISADETMTVHMPRDGAIVRMNDAYQRGDLRAVLRELLGEDNANRMLELIESAPAGTLNRFINDLLGEFGIDLSGNSVTSSR